MKLDDEISDRTRRTVLKRSSSFKNRITNQLVSAVTSSKSNRRANILGATHKEYISNLKTELFNLNVQTKESKMNIENDSSDNNQMWTGFRDDMNDTNLRLEDQTPKQLDFAE